DGYGLSAEAVEKCLQKYPAQVLLAVDCGTNSRAVIQTLREGGVKVLILDHHQPESAERHNAVLINPRATAGSGSSAVGNGCSSSAHGAELCSVGLAFKLAHALVKQGRQLGLAEANQFDLRLLLDLVALGTIADLSPLKGENRILVSAGLERVNRHARIGLTALKQVAQCPPMLGVHEIGFQLAPRL